MRSAMRTVEKRWETRIVMRPLPLSPAAARRRGVALEQRVFGLRVQRGGRLVEDQQQRLVAHEAARQRELLPLAERQLDSARPRRTELRVEARRQTGDDVAGAGAIDRRDHRGLVVQPGDVAQTDRVPRAEFEAEEILERARQARPPLAGRHARQRRVVHEDRTG